MACPGVGVMDLIEGNHGLVEQIQIYAIEPESMLV
jgi:hypothetical protein